MSEIQTITGYKGGDKFNWKEWLSRKWISFSRIWALGSEPIDTIRSIVHFDDFLKLVTAVGVTALIFQVDFLFWLGASVLFLGLWTFARLGWGFYQERHLEMVQKSKEWDNVRDDVKMETLENTRILVETLIDEPVKDLQGTIDVKKGLK